MCVYGVQSALHMKPPVTTPTVGLASGLGSGVFEIGVFGQFLVFGGRLGSAIHNDLPVLYGFTEEVFAHVLGLWAKDVLFSCEALEGCGAEGCSVWKFSSI